MWAYLYFIGCFISMLPITRAFVTDFGKESVDQADGETWAIALMMAVCLCWAWLAVIPGYIVYKIVKGWG